MSNCTGINNLDSNASEYNFLVYPNPSKGIFNVEVNAKVPFALTSIEVTDALGRVLISDKINAVTYQINLSNYENGIYFIKVSEDGKAKTVKIVKD